MKFWGARALLLVVWALSPSFPTMAQHRPPARPRASRTAAVPPLPRLAFIDQRLANGLRVLIAADHAAPVFGIAVTYRFGTRDDPEGAWGITRLVERMMFLGSPHVGRFEHRFFVLQNGGELGAELTEDRATFYEAFPSNQLDLALFLESDRMRSLSFTQAKLDEARQDVKSALESANRQSHPAEELASLLYEHSAYRRVARASEKNLNTIGLEAVEDFYRQYCAPGDAIIALAGDLDPATTLERVKRYFASVPARALPKPPDLAEPYPAAPRRKTLEDPSLTSARLLVGYLVPPGHAPEVYALEVLAAALNREGGGRLYEFLAQQKHLASSAEALLDVREGPGLFYVSATPLPGVKPEEVEKAIGDAIASFAHRPVSSSQLQAIRLQFLRRQIAFRESDVVTAVQLGRFAAIFNDPDLINTATQHLNAVTAEEVQQVAAQELVPARRAVLWASPAKPRTEPGHSNGGGSR